MGGQMLGAKHLMPIKHLLGLKSQSIDKHLIGFKPTVGSVGVERRLGSSVSAPVLSGMKRGPQDFERMMDIMPKVAREME